MLIEFVKPDFVFENEAGQLNQLVHDGWKQVNVVKYRKGTISGGHYHKYNEECDSEAKKQAGIFTKK